MGSTHSRILWLIWYHLFNQQERKQISKGLYYQNDVESQHTVEKCIRSYKKEDILLVIKNLKWPSDQQDTEEVRALYDAGSYIVNEPYKKFLVQSNEWHSWNDSRKRDHVKKFRQYVPCMSDRFSESKNSGRKSSYQTRHSSSEPDVVKDRHRDRNRSKNNCFRKSGFCNIDPTWRNNEVHRPKAIS